MAEMTRYGIDLEALTSGRGSFVSSFSHYQEVPKQIAEKVIAESGRREQDD